MLRILIADRSEEFCQSLKQQLSQNFDVSVCHDGRQALDLCYCNSPDILIIDLHLPIIDGLGVIRILTSSGRDMGILATTVCTYSDYVLQSLAQLGVQYILPKPCTVTAVVCRVQELALMRTRKSWSRCDEVTNILLALGVRPSLSGFPCVYEAVLSHAGDTTQPMTKVVYPAVAQICGGNAKRIERAIRCVITDAWKNRDESVWHLYFSPGRDGRIPCPTNSQFISRVAMCLNQKKNAS